MDTIRKRLVVIIAMAVLIPALSSFTPMGTKPRKAKNIILMIGDGMGVAQMYAAWTMNHRMLNMTTCPFTGLSLTYSADDYITDSAAGATAMSTGEKTKNGYLAVDTAGKPLKTILEIAEEKNLATGLVSTSAITHATPAGFIVHEKLRDDYESIAADFLKTDIDVFIGGGADHFRKRKDNRDLTKELAAKGYQLAFSIEEAAKFQKGKLAALTAPEHNPKMSDGRGNMLSEATQTALNILSKNSNGFFLMVEGSQIDWGNHANDEHYVIDETIDFDHAVGVALDYARKNENTLVIIIADHESGGMTITNGKLYDATVKAEFSTHFHTAVPVPVYAFGPGAEMFTGVYENTSIFQKMMRAYGFSQ
jgi:alkaline phosphatase